MIEAKLNAHIDRLVSTGSKLRAVATVTINDWIDIHGISIVEGNEGLFVSMPRSKLQLSDGTVRYRDRVHPTPEFRAAINEAVMSAYDIAIAQDNEPVMQEQAV